MPPQPHGMLTEAYVRQREAAERDIAAIEERFEVIHITVKQY